MSKAFTNEDSVASEVVARRPARLSPGEKRYVTPEGHRALREQLERAASERASLAGTEPRLGKEARLAELDQRAQSIAATLSTLTVAPPPAQPDRVLFGAWVTLETEDGATVRYRLVGPDEADAKASLISVESPLARALLGKREGEEATAQLPRGPVEFTVTKVSYDAAD